jgi:hypothetical protein
VRCSPVAEAAGRGPSSRGLLLLGGKADRVASWVRTGVVAARVVDLEGWTAVCPAEPSSRAAAPYDDALSVLAARPLRGRLRPGLGFFVIEERAVVTVQPKGFRGAQRWMLWAPGRGILHAPHLDELHPEELVRVSGRRGSDEAAALRVVLGRREGAPLGWLVELVTALGLPGAGLLSRGQGQSGRLVEPDWRSVAGFDALMADEARADPVLPPVDPGRPDAGGRG